MTDTTPNNSSLRVDLRPIDSVPDGARRDAIVHTAIGRAMRRRAVARQPQVQTTMATLATLAAWAPRVLATAALLLIVALAALRALPGSPRDNRVSTVASWLGGGRVPTNGELLAEFGGYGR